MPEGWELVPDVERAQEEVTLFILFCEDGVNEPAYFKSFQKEKKVKVSIVDNQKNSYRNLANAVLYCYQKGLMDLHQGHYNLLPGVTSNIWCVYDRDVETINPTLIKAENNYIFSTAIQSAELTGLKVAWSNDVFELWILLHFEEVPAGVWQHRRQIYDRLSTILKSLPDQSTELASITSNPHFDYKSHVKRSGNFQKHIQPLLPSRYNTAIANAQILEAAFTTATPYHDCNPCTKVHHLVQSILSFH